tara:strand:- start:1464 stop:3047 length:1584 start_codon:yes stop_codon:yes gene_type:complete
MSLDYEDDVLDAMFDDNSGVSQDGDSGVSQDKIDEAKAMLRAMMGINQPSGGPAGSTQGLAIPSLDKSFAKYKEQLSEIYGRRPRPTIYDLASTVGGAMLAADPTTGAFRSAGIGLAQFNKEQMALREQKRQEDRAIGLKAFELAKADVDSANNFLNEYRLLQAKTDPDNKVTEVLVTNESGITVGGVFYPKGTQPLLTESEIYKNRNSVTPVASPVGGVKVPDAGAVAIYSTREDAEKIILGLGMKRDNPNFKRAVEQLIPKDPETGEFDPSLVGNRMISGGRYVELRPYIIGDEVFNILLNTAQGETTDFKDYTTDRLKLIAKSTAEFADKSLMVLPQVDRAMRILLEGVKTGALEAKLFPFKKAFVDIFGLDDDETTSLDTLVAISNVLATKMRPQGSGATSDYEFRAYKLAILDLGNTSKANYIALYVYKKMTENAIAYNRKEQELLTSGDYIKAEQVNDKLNEIDPGVFYTYEGDGNDEEAIKAFLDTVPNGGVITNKDPDGVEIVKGEGPFIIKGWPEEKK